MRLITILVVTFLSFSIMAEGANEDGVGKSYGDWTEYCEKVENSVDICNISQTLVGEENQQLILSIRISYVPGKKEPLVFATLPLGALLTYSPLLKVSKTQTLKMAYQYCDISGCTAVAVMNSAIVKAMKAETQAIVRSVNIARKAIEIPVSLDGFSRGLNKLTRLKKKQ